MTADFRQGKPQALEVPTHSSHHIGVCLLPREYAQAPLTVQVSELELIHRGLLPIVGKRKQTSPPGGEKAIEHVVQVDRSVRPLRNIALTPVPDTEQRGIDCGRVTIERP